MKRTTFLKIGAAIACVNGAAGSATELSMSGTVSDSCVITLAVPGTLALSTDGTSMATTNGGGNSGELTIVATGTNPTISFAAPALTDAPPTYTRTPLITVGYTSTDGANQAQTSGSSSYTVSGFTDAVTIDGVITDTDGFSAGNYTMRTVATCSQ